MAQAEDGKDGAAPMQYRTARDSKDREYNQFMVSGRSCMYRLAGQADAWCVQEPNQAMPRCAGVWDTVRVPCQVCSDQANRKGRIWHRLVSQADTAHASSGAPP
jgi:hypothetical protein